MPKTSIEFAFERETKNTYRFLETGLEGPDDRGTIGTLYVQKSAFKSQPKGLKVTIETVD